MIAKLISVPTGSVVCLVGPDSAPDKLDCEIDSVLTGSVVCLVGPDSAPDKLDCEKGGNYSKKKKGGNYSKISRVEKGEITR